MQMVTDGLAAAEAVFTTMAQDDDCGFNNRLCRACMRK